MMQTATMLEGGMTTYDSVFCVRTSRSGVVVSLVYRCVEFMMLIPMGWYPGTTFRNTCYVNAEVNSYTFSNLLDLAMQRIWLVL